MYTSQGFGIRRVSKLSQEGDSVANQTLDHWKFQNQNDQESTGNRGRHYRRQDINMGVMCTRNCKYYFVVVSLQCSSYYRFLFLDRLLFLEGRSSSLTRSLANCITFVTSSSVAGPDPANRIRPRLSIKKT
mmetsp:Transcript_13540/g.32674  ORF Transcript_13540/g.32674 Transcript_13540/m.32674 type:complete len:131 (+) Transcript_13540:1924-2316(+)